MGRHRRSAPASPEAAGAADRTGPPAAAHPASAGRHRGHRSARDRHTAPVRTGLLGASAAVAMGAVAVASGLLPGGSQYDWNGSGGAGERVRAGSLPTASTPDAASVTPSDRGTGQASRGEARPGIPERERPAPAATPSAAPASRQPSAPADTDTDTDTGAGTGTGVGTDRDRTERPGRTVPSSSAAPSKTAPSATAAPDTTPSTAESQVLALVNQERAKAGCSPLTADRQLGGLARDFSADMARRGFFDHTDPDGRSPWDRAKAAGIEGLGGENIARGQADARAVMDTWMHSSGHRANILNCEYKTLGVGVHFGSGGPWWTQDFGF
ncbi:CAP domain-containing protein [Streptomyces albofaciens JCM 4342]|uniref:CAP domain-containing protein n=1 Tax=Streptomyces albofaciens TaxID=66866 RepID=UPI001239E403|nr:CAP domain-containing protein [Streptomyces albofaciens]KAA6213744.1 CAP domain-containing protein [Streptomyces albofaciens JCM 4342]